MIVEKVDFPFVTEQMIKDYRKTLLDLGKGPFASIACDQGGSEDYKIYNATKYAVELTASGNGRGAVTWLTARCNYDDIREGLAREKADRRRAQRREYSRKRREKQNAAD